MPLPSDATATTSLDAPWSIGESAFTAIVQNMSELTPKVIVEFGSGVSSVRLAKAFPDAQILSLEHDSRFFGRSLELAAQHGIGSENLHIELRPLRFRLIGSRIYETYDRGWFPHTIDAVLIDGPPWWTGRGREACLHDVVAKLRTGGRAYLDDYHRDAERKIVDNWMRSYPGVFDMSEIDVGHGIGALQKRAVNTRSPRLAPGAALDTWLDFAKRRCWNALKALSGRDDRFR